MSTPKPPVDALGNPLGEGMLIQYTAPSKALFGHITKMSLGGIEIPNSGGKVTPGVLHIEVGIDIAWPASSPKQVQIEQILRIVDPKTQAVVEALVEATPTQPSDVGRVMADKIKSIRPPNPTEKGPEK